MFYVTKDGKNISEFRCYESAKEVAELIDGDIVEDKTPIIGYYNDYEGGDFVTINDLKARLSTSHFTLCNYLDRRKVTNLTRFNYDPWTGEKIDWNKIRKENKLC